MGPASMAWGGKRGVLWLFRWRRSVRCGCRVNGMPPLGALRAYGVPMMPLLVAFDRRGVLRNTAAGRGGFFALAGASGLVRSGS
jgi:hypothetical protein